MYSNSTWEDDKYRSRRHSKNKPSFSSTLLDQIYRSIDEDFKPKKLDAKINRTDDEDMLVQDHAVYKIRTRPTVDQDNDFFFFSSTSTSSDSSDALSSTDTESKVSCLRPPKPVRTHENKTDKVKSRASKILYANFRRVKQPLSPGGRLATFLNSLFHSTNTNEKKSKHLDPDHSSAVTSFSRSCLSKCPVDKSRNGNGTTVRFNPLGVIVDQDSHSVGQKCIYGGKFGRPPLPLLNASAKLKSSIKHREGKAHDALRAFHSQREDKPSMLTKTRGKEDDEDEDGVLSDSSSDLFELDHLNMFGNELPVYETTRLDTTTTKRGSVSRLIR